MPSNRNDSRKGAANFQPALANHILTVCEITAELPFEPIPNVILRKASPLERAYISHTMNQIRGDSGPAIYHEAQWFFPKNGYTYGSEPDQEKWRYYVLEQPSPQELLVTHTTMHLLGMAALISEPRFRWAITTMKDPPGPYSSLGPTSGLIVWLEHELAKILQQRRVSTVSSEDLYDWKVATKELTDLRPEFSFISDAILLYEASFDIHPSSRLRVLALFAVIELLVTHKPKGTDTGDSLTRQLKTKLKLLANRFAKPLHPKDHFSMESNDVAWEVIYNYRSLIAHGGKIDFQTPYKKQKQEEGAQQLTSDRNVVYFLEEFTRRLLRHALREPPLIVDLKEC